MPKLDDLVKNGTPLGIAIGLGAAIAATVIVPALPAIVRASRPTARAAIKSGLVLLEKGREVMAEANEEFDDMLAEVKAELKQERKARTAHVDDTEVVIKSNSDEA
ncbi:DUF5132 domain-containing protein [Methylomonas rivi]|uniref:DUF5132 domain-containing protein n=1 Tax=Methylomonas rivi TaxID=2952226 RepID=A0ABT1U3P2_9GAMM|nr:DUF5132 domain-containing protein [Methylomonas sp. WSC-6]MBS4050951.1 DUF5132 domain-containing protein [Methylomonas sp.]MCQ8128469.1 DUF5132 domain-containing protein [Methylomonas sp. WSC-6]